MSDLELVVAALSTEHGRGVADVTVRSGLLPSTVRSVMRELLAYGDIQECDEGGWTLT